MPLKTSVKVSHISNLSDARYCAGMGVELLGFRVIPGEVHYMPPHVFQEIRGWIAGPAIVAEMYGLTGTDQISEVMQKYSPDYFELSYDEYRAFHTALPLPCLVYFQDTRLGNTIGDDEKIVFALVDGHVSCNDVQAFTKPVLIRLSTLDQLPDKLSAACFKGVVLEGPEEKRPGITNYEQLGGLLEALDEE